MAATPAAKVHKALSGPHWMFYMFLAVAILLNALLAFAIMVAMRTEPVNLLDPNAIIYIGFAVLLIGIAIGWWWLLFRLEPGIVAFVDQFGAYVRDARYIRGGTQEGLFLDFDGGLHLRATPRTLSFWRFYGGGKDRNPSAFAAGDSLLQTNAPGAVRVCRVQRRFRRDDQTELGLAGQRFGARALRVQLTGNPLRPDMTWEVLVLFRATGWQKRGPDLRNALSNLGTALERVGLEMQADALRARQAAPATIQ